MNQVSYISRMLLRVILLIGLVLHVSAAMADQSPCPKVIITSRDTIEFSDTEKRLLCGDRDDKAWEDIPSYQAQFFMRSFLQSRAYLEPTFEIKNDVLYVHPGEKVELKSLEIIPKSLVEKEAIEKELLPVFEKKPLTPSLLNELQASSVGILREKAYACAKAKAYAQVVNSHVVIELENLSRYKFGDIQIDDTGGVYEQALKRFYPFTSEQAFDASLLELAEKRLIRSGVAQAGYFIEECQGEDLSIEQRFIFGRPRVLRFGVGASTELGPLLRVKWSNNRYKKMASQLKAQLQASFKNQSLTLSAKQYKWKSYPRRSLVSEFEVLREDQTDFEEVNIALRSWPMWEMDTQDRFWSFSAGPSYLNGVYRSDVEQDSTSFSALSFGSEIKSIEHDYEVYDFHPQEGSATSFDIDYRPEELGFSSTITGLRLSHTEVGKLSRAGRGILIGALRLQSNLAIVRNTVELEDLPPSVKYYGGGSTDLRGYPLKSLPENNGAGAVTKVLFKTELRKTHFFKPTLEAFMFYDVAKFGARSWELSERYFHSPGVGVRWMSPIGLTQVYVSQALATKPREDNGQLIYLGLGGEF